MRSFLLLGSISAVLAADCANTLKTSYQAPVAGDGWGYRLIANDLTRPRSIAFDGDGGLLVLDSGEGIVRLTLDDHGGSCLTVKDKKTLVDNAELNHGLALSNDGKTLYGSTGNDVLAWSYDGAGTVSGDGTVIVTNMTNAMHKTRTILVTSNDGLLVSRGSAANADSLARDKGSGHCQIRAFNASTEKQDYASGGETVGWGLRNSVGIAEHPDGGIWSVENSVDMLSRMGIDIHNDNPAEELNYHGKVDELRGANYGYPSCYTLWGTTGVPDIGNMTTGDQFAVGGAEGEAVDSPPTDAQCNADYAAPELSFQAHMAPLDIKFDSNGTTAYISFHGSWNRDEPVGYAVATVPFADGKPVPAANSTDGTTEILRNADLSKCPEECFRPVGLAWDKAGRLWVASDSTGEIFVLVKGGEGAEGSPSGNASGDDKNAARRNIDSRMALALVAPIFIAWMW